MLKLNQKLLLILGALSATLLICGFAGLHGKKLLSDNLDFVTGPAWDAADGAMEGVIGIQQQIIAIHQLAQAGGNRATTSKLLSDGEARADESLHRMIDTGLIDNDMAQQLKRKLAEFSSDKTALAAIYQNGASNQQKEMEFNHTASDLLAFISRLEEVADRQVEGQAENIAAAKSTATTLVVSMMILGCFVAVGAYIFAHRAIVAPIRQTANLLQDISEGDGDLTVRLKVTSADEIGSVAIAFNRFVEKLQRILSKVAEATEHVASSADSLAASSTQARGGWERQHAETDMVATAMNQMTATVQEIASYATQAASSTESANLVSIEGQQIVSQTIELIQTLAAEIQHSADVIKGLEYDSQQIGSVLDVIKGVAEQTNLLALNAAIEAARAGEQGRGFAVVADEVRALAGRTQLSTEEIQSMINNLQNSAVGAVQAMARGQQQAEQSVKQAEQAGASLEEMLENISQLNQLNLQVATASEEQSGVADEINRNIIRIRDLGIETVEAAQTTSDESQNLLTLAGELRQHIGQFKV